MDLEGLIRDLGLKLLLDPPLALISTKRENFSRPQNSQFSAQDFPDKKAREPTIHRLYSKLNS